MSKVRVSVRRKAPNASTLSNVYAAIRSVIGDAEAYYYTREQIEMLFTDENNVFVERKNDGRKR